MNVQSGYGMQQPRFQAQNQATNVSGQQQNRQQPNAVKFGIIDGGIISGPLACCAAPVACCAAPVVLVLAGGLIFGLVKLTKSLAKKAGQGISGGTRKLGNINPFKGKKAEQAQAAQQAAG